MMKVLTSILLLLTSTVNYAQNISGSVQDFHFSNPIDSVSVTLMDNSSGEILGSGSTNEAGNYSIDYTIVGVNDFNPVPSDFYLSNPYPNPFNPSARIDFNTPVQGRFTVRIFNVIGQLVYSKDFTIDAGSTHLTYPVWEAQVFICLTLQEKISQKLRSLCCLMAEATI